MSEFEILREDLAAVRSAVVALNDEFMGLSRSLAVCQAASALRREQSRGWVKWVGVVAAGLIVTAAEFFFHRR